MKKQLSERWRKVIRIVSFLGIAYVLACLLLGWAVQIWAKSQVAFLDTASIGIIGGADGPTAIFVTSSVNVADGILLTLVLIASLLGIYLTRKKKA